MKHKDMKDHRQGNDLAVLWSIFKDGEPFDLRGRSLKLYLKNLHERKEVVDFSVTGNEIHWTFYGKDQDTLGKHSLILVANEDEKGMITTDACDFVRLVSCSCKLQGGEDAPNVETESIELTSTLEYVAGGGDYDDTALRKELENKVDKVEGLGLSEENYTAEDKEKLAGLENYDDSVIKGELAKKIESEVVVDTESTEDFEFGYDDTGIRQEIAELSAEVSGLSEGIALRNVGAEDTDESVDEPEIGGGGDSHWVLRETHTFDGVNGTITISDLPMEFLALLDYNGTIDVAKKVNFQVGAPELMRAAYDFAASRQMHIGFHLTSDGVITNIISHSSEWNNTDAATPKIVYSSIVLPQAFKLFVYANSIIPEGTTIKIYTR